jgi:hypothetical protein
MARAFGSVKIVISVGPSSKKALFNSVFTLSGLVLAGF